MTRRFSKNLISVIVPYFNRERFLANTIRSLLKQTHSDLQLILADDGSTDQSYEIAKSFKDPRILLIRSAKRRGKPRTVNRTLALAQGRWIAFFDSDDLMTHRSLEIRLKFLKKRPRPMAVMGRVGRLIDASGKPLSSAHPLKADARASLRSARNCVRKFGGLVPELFVNGPCPLSPLSSTLFTREAVHRLGALDESFPIWEDRDYLMRLSLRMPVPFLDEPVLWYRVHEDNSSFRIKNGRPFHALAASLEKKLRLKYERSS